MKKIPYDKEDKRLVDSIKRIPAFAPLNDTLLNDVMSMADITDYDKREYVLFQGEVDTRMFFLMSGKLSVQVDQVEVTVLTKPNTVFGEMGIIDKKPRSASVVARKESRILALDIGFFDRLEGRAKLAVQAFFYKMFYTILVDRLRAANEHIADLDMQRAILENMEID